MSISDSDIEAWAQELWGRELGSHYCLDEDLFMREVKAAGRRLLRLAGARPREVGYHWYPDACLRCGAPLPGRPDAERAFGQLLRLLPHYSRDAIAAQLREMLSAVRGYCHGCAQAPAHGRCPCGAEATTVVVRLDSGGELYSCDSCELTRPLPAQTRLT